MKTKKFLLLALLALIISVPMKAQMTQFKAMYLYNFAKNVGWPDAEAGMDFIITVIGDNEMATELQKMAATRKVGTRNVTVLQAPTAAAAEKSNIYYVGETKATQIPALFNNHGKGAIIVSGKQGQALSGATICFFNADGKLKYEVSQGNVKKCGLSISSKIIELGKLVD